jgi:hypothetical protein
VVLEDKERRSLTPRHGKALKEALPLLEYHVLVLRDIQLLLDGEQMSIMLLLVSTASNHIASLVS